MFVLSSQQKCHLRRQRAATAMNPKINPSAKSSNPDQTNSLPRSNGTAFDFRTMASQFRSAKKEEEVDMRRRLISTALSMTCLLLVAVMAQAQTRVYRGTNRNVRALIVRIENRATVFTNNIQDWANQSSNNAYSPAAGEDISVFVRDFDDSVRQLRDRFDARH